MAVRNDSAGRLALWLEPLGEDRWLRPGETFRIWSPYTGDELEFIVNYWGDHDDRAAGIENMTLWIQNGDPSAVVVTDDVGTVVECGHRRPPEIGKKRAEKYEAARSRVVDSEPSGGP